MKGLISQAPFGKTPDGAPVDIFTLRNAGGVEARICNYGGIIVSLKAPDRAGDLGDVVLGYDHLEGYLANNPFFGALVGRFANRIAKGKFTLEGVTYSLAANNGPNALHGGLKGFDKVVWQVARTAAAPRTDAGVELPEQGRRRRLPRQPQGQGGLFPDRPTMPCAWISPPPRTRPPL